jgi:hypothetical protein
MLDHRSPSTNVLCLTSSIIYTQLGSSVLFVTPTRQNISTAIHDNTAALTVDDDEIPASLACLSLLTMLAVPTRSDGGTGSSVIAGSILPLIVAVGACILAALIAAASSSNSASSSASSLFENVEDIASDISCISLIYAITIQELIDFDNCRLVRHNVVILQIIGFCTD